MVPFAEFPSSLDASDSAAPILIGEQERLKSLLNLRLLDTSAEKEFDQLVELGARMCGTPVALISVVDKRRVFYKAKWGTEMVETPRQLSLCSQVVCRGEAVVVEDIAASTSFSGPAVMAAYGGMRFYAGVPLVSPSGEKIGALCVLDTVARSLNPDQIAGLRLLADQIGTLISLRMERDRCRASEYMLRCFLDGLPVETLLKDEQGRILFYNKKLAEKFGISNTTWLGKTSRDLWPEDVACRIMRDDAAALKSGEILEHTVETPGQDNLVKTWKIKRIPLKASDGSMMLASITLDITEQVLRERTAKDQRRALEKQNRKLLSISLTDPLTRLFNRRAFDLRLWECVLAARQTGTPLSLLVLDLDDFKSINDEFGHTAGDQVLMRLAEIIGQAKRAGDIAARTGGEEFAIIIPEADATQAVSLGNRVVEAIRAERWELRAMTASIGCASLKGKMDGMTLYEAADEALYMAKEAGKNRLVLHPASLSPAMPASKDTIGAGVRRLG